MEDLGIWAQLLQYSVYWPLVVMSGALTLVGKVSAAIFHRDAKGWRWLAHKTLTVQPLAWGSLAALVFRPSMPGIETLGMQVLSGIGCGVVSVFCYQVGKGLLKRRGIDLDLPGLDGPDDDQ